MDAHGALDSLLGRLTAVLVSEAQLLGGLRGAVEFIKDEMESMNGLVLHLTDAQERDHQVRAWMKQVVELTRDCEANVELYIHHVVGATAGGGGGGVLGFLRRLPWLLRSIRARHRVATRIRELKARARDVGDRRLRYGVTVPSSDHPGSDHLPAAGDGEDQEEEQADADAAADDEHVRRRRHCTLLAEDSRQLGDAATTTQNKAIDRLVKLVLDEDEGSESPPAAAARDDDDHDEQEMMRVFAVTYLYFLEFYESAERIARGAYQHPSVVSSFDCMASVRQSSLKDDAKILQEILQHVGAAAAAAGQENNKLISEKVSDDDYDQLAELLQASLTGKRFLIVLENLNPHTWKYNKGALLNAASAHGSSGTIIVTTESDFASKLTSSPHRIIRSQLPYHAFYDRAEELIAGSEYCDTVLVRDILLDCDPDAFAMRMLLHLLYVNPNRTTDELHKFQNILSECKRLKKSMAKQMVMFCYSELPTKYRSCLLYLAVFPKHQVIRRTCLARRWIAEGLITDAKAGWRSTMDEAEHYFDVLVTRGFLCPGEISAGGKIKTCALHHHVHSFIRKVAADVNFVDTNLTPKLAHHLSIHNRIGLQAVSHELGLDNSNGIVDFLPSLAASSQWQVLKMLDLEGSKGLKNKKHLKCICNILLLKYLSLRNTDVVQLPKQIEKLQCLETLDIRQTKVRALAKRPIVLPMLKHFLAGIKINENVNDPTNFEESFYTVPVAHLCTGRMKNMEVLSHVQLSNSRKDLTGIAQLLKLRKFGVVLHHGTNAKLNDLLGKMHRYLRSLSVWIDRPYHDAVTAEDVPLAAPKSLESLRISGITGGLSHLIQPLQKLSKITLIKTYFGDDVLCILGKLSALHGLRLGHKSYTGRELSFKAEEFQSLMVLFIEGSDITSISIADGSTPKLERIVWSFATIQSISGMHHLPSLHKLELKGDCNPEVLHPVIKAMDEHANYPVFKHTPRYHCEQVGTDLEATSAP